MVLTRLFSGLVGIGLFLALCFGGALPFALGVTVLTAMGAWEFVEAYRHALCLKTVPGETPPITPIGVRVNTAVAYLSVACPLLAHWLLRNGPALPESNLRLLNLTMYALPLGVFAARLARAVWTGKALGRMRSYFGLVGLAYIGLLFSSFVLLRELPGVLRVSPFGSADKGAWLMLFVAACVWATDTFAYFVGRALGKHKLAPALSPAKTIEGAIGGLCGAMAVGAAFGNWIHLPLVHGLAIGAIAGTVGQMGDLFESALKREIGVKDFGHVMPGHGGALDRFDSLLFVVPLAYLYLRLIAGFVIR